MVITIAAATFAALVCVAQSAPWDPKFTSQTTAEMCAGNLMVNGGFEEPNTLDTRNKVPNPTANSRWGWYKAIPGDMQCSAVPLWQTALCKLLQLVMPCIATLPASQWAWLLATPDVVFICHPTLCRCPGWYTTRSDGLPCVKVDWQSK